MASYGYTLFCEGNDPRDLVSAAVAAEGAGFDDLVISDHFHPWVPEHEHSPFAWAVLGALAHATERARLATMVTCPIVRYHPAIVAQMAATIGVMSDGRFTLGLGAGERLNEHVVGEGWPPAEVRHEMLSEAVEVIQALWTGEYVSHRGPHFEVEDARIFDLPEAGMEMFVAASGPASVQLSIQAGGLCTTDPLPELVSTFTAGGGSPSSTWTQIPLSWHADEAEAIRLAKERFRFGLLGWKVMAELPNPVNFEAACRTVRPEDVAGAIPHGPDPEPYIEAIRSFRDAGFDHLSIVPVGDDLEGTLRFWEREVAPEVRSFSAVG